MKEELSSEIIKDVVLTELKQFPDERGTLLHMLRNDDPTFTTFGECYFSEVLPGAVKAWKLHREQTQHFCVPVGRIKLVIYDNRKDSVSNGNVQLINLGRPDSYFRIMIPPGLWYGFTCISKIPALLVNCADIPHNPQESEVRMIDDVSIPYKWK
jgi:dTDP-4-dehydrorhamnose 3,5-epimerase